MPELGIEAQCREARQLLKQATDLLADAAWKAGQSKNHELDKSITAAARTIDGVQLLLISLPRLKG